MNHANAQTIESYNTHVNEYVDNTVHEVSGTVKDWLNNSLSAIPTTAKILEIGSAFGRDAQYMTHLGYTVQCTDATPAFVNLLHSKGIDATTLNAITDELPQGLDIVIANAVLLHFTRSDAMHVLDKVYHALNPGGRFAFTLKRGEGDGWSDEKLNAPRYFCYWSESQIRDALQTAGFTAINISNDDAKWLHIIAKKEMA